jgi:predicted nucleic acid-binding protein
MPAAEISQTVVLDASVVVRWVVDEAGTPEAVALLESDFSWIAPRLMLTEAASALRRKVVDEVIEPEIAIQALDTIIQAVQDGVVRLMEDERIVSAALMVALDVRHKIPDCVYLALAEREGAAIATADDKLAKLARARGVPVHKVPHG